MLNTNHFIAKMFHKMPLFLENNTTGKKSKASSSLYFHADATINTNIIRLTYILGIR